MIEERARILLELDSRPQSVALVRCVLTAVAAVAALDQALLDDLKTAVSEACNNVVLHAYEEMAGSLSVAISISPRLVGVNVRDHGGGFRQMSQRPGRGGVGMAVMSALASSAQFATPEGGGTEVQLSFKRDREPLVFESTQPEGDEVRISGDVVIHVHPISLLGPVVGGLARAMAAASDFSHAGSAGVYPITDALGDYADQAADGSVVGVGIAAAPHRLDVVASPFRTNRSGSGRLAALVDTLTVEAVASHEVFHLTVLDHG